ncbi:sigma-70 family RNA polymerase sigma factor [Bacillus megaterium]|uniref:Sigma-70 family RNA polymerase sigma factor n=1 Tax=Priestia megaterium TaxID=1404 RepID=A0AAX6BJP5_PRIMG|nr:sigma-70 family RNA polymerase sigma factor [Priestia megaterium]NGY86483.1 sigma-70 family RNA polymerase sigma factor [Priestia megaterium]QFY73263.1 RNA polymerase subunit sigma-70 [Priestia megaterium]GMG73982.1 sigma-70 family RNA polymerase sigma factor [Priestia megaterium]
MKNRLSNDQLKIVMNQLYSYLIKQGANQETAKDIFQEAVCKLLLHLESIDTDKYKSWLFKVAINLYYDHCRKNKKSQYVVVEDYLITNERLIEEIMIVQENQLLVRSILQKLSPTFKQLLLLKYELEWSYKQIAEYVDMKPEAVKTYLARARKTFKEMYRRECNEENE